MGNNTIGDPLQYQSRSHDADKSASLTYLVIGSE